MKKPHLVKNLYAETNDGKKVPVSGACSACPKSAFLVGDDPAGVEKKLEDLFEAHFREVHLNEDASQSAARIVREATE